MKNETKKGGRNSILEILRLCAALWVMYYHGMTFIEKNQCFDNGRIAVEFFFMLSGFFFLATYCKEDDKNTWKGLLSFVWKRFKPLAITFGICMIFSIIYYIQFFEGLFEPDIFGYLWYVPQLLAVLAFFFLLKRLIKNQTIFNIVVAVLSITAYALILTYTTNFGIVRGIASVGCGILLSQIPKLKFKGNQIFSIIMTIMLFVAITILAIIVIPNQLHDCLCLPLLFPAIIYFASNVNFSNKTINTICSISFGLYAYQTLPRLLGENGIVTIGWQLALIVFALATIDLVIKYIVKKAKNKKQDKNQPTQTQKDVLS